MITRLLGPSLLLSSPVPFQAPPRLSLVDDIRSSLQRRYQDEDVERVLSAWRAMADGHVHDENLPGFEAEPMLRQQSNSYVDGLPVRLFYEEPTRDFAWARALEQHAPVVRDEFLSVMQSDVLEREGNNVWTGLADIRDASTVAYGPEWRTLGLLDRGVWDPINCRIFPKTAALLKESGTPCVEAFFAKMPAGSSIGAHSDGCNFHLTSHLGVDVPEGECWLQARWTHRDGGGGVAAACRLVAVGARPAAAPHSCSSPTRARPTAPVHRPATRDAPTPLRLPQHVAPTTTRDARAGGRRATRVA